MLLLGSIFYWAWILTGSRPEPAGKGAAQFPRLVAFFGRAACFRPITYLTTAFLRAPFRLSAAFLSARTRQRLPKLLLLAAVLCFAGGYLASRYGQAPGVVQRTDVARLQDVVREAEATARREADTVATQLQRSPYSFQLLLAETTYPTCVLENGVLRGVGDALTP